MRKYQSFFVEKSALELREFGSIAERYENIQFIEDYQAFRKESILLEKNCLIFARKRGKWLKPFHCYDHNKPEGEGTQYWSLDVAEGCLFDCVYCYLQSHLNHGALVLFIDKDSLLEELRSLPPGSNWISTGLLSDSLLAENHYPVLPQISKAIPADSILELRTKSSDISTLRKPEICKEQVVISWSLNPDEIAKSFEFGAASLEERLISAKRTIDLGYRVGFHLDPIFYYEGWYEAYQNLFERLKEFASERIAFISIGLFRYMPDLGEVIRKRFPFHPILSGEFFPDSDGKYHYFRPIRKQMYAAFSKWLEPMEGIPVMWSMETIDVGK